MKTWENWLVLSLLLVFGLIGYAHVLDGPFLFDDHLLIEKNTFIRSLSNWPQYFMSSSEAGALLNTSNFYRPTQTFSFALIYSIFGLNPLPYHVLSFLLHLLNSYLLFIFFTRFTLSRFASFLGATLFLIHPVQVEAVSYISGVADPLGLSFVLLALLSFLNIYSDKDGAFSFKYLIMSYVFFILALLSKETTVIFFLLAGLVGWAKRDYSIKIVAGYLLVTFIYLLLRFTVLNFTGNFVLTGTEDAYTNSLIIRLITFVSVLWDYMGLIVFPKHLYIERPYIFYESIVSWRFLFGIVVLVGGLMGSLYSLRHKKEYALAYFWFFIALIPVSGIVPLNAIYLEHWLYIPLIGFCIAIAATYDILNSPRHRKLFVGLFCLFCLFCVYRVVQRNDEWSNAIAFYNNEITYNPRSARMFNNLAMEYSDNGNFQEAIANYRKAIAIQDRYPQTHHNLARAYLATGQIETGYQEYLKALQINPNFIHTYLGLRELFMTLKDPKRISIVATFINRIQSGEQLTYEEVVSKLKP